MSDEIKCGVCKEDIKASDDVVLGSKDDYTTLPEDVKASNIVFLHVDCLKKYLEERKENDGK